MTTQAKPRVRVSRPWPDEVGPPPVMQQIRFGSGQVGTTEVGFIELWLNIYWPDLDFLQRVSGIVCAGMAAEMIGMLREALPECDMGLTRVRHHDVTDLQAILPTHQRILDLVVAVRNSDRPGEELLSRLGLAGASVATRELFDASSVETGEGGL